MPVHEVYRGEHGAEAPETGFHTRLPSISFGSKRAAEIYARKPNNRTDLFAARPRVRCFQITIENPILDDPDDPFVDVSLLIEKLGEPFARQMALRHAEHIRHTNNWEEEFSGHFDSVEDLLARAPERLGELYMNAYPLLDDPDFIAAAAAAGFDGAIYAGTGENALEAEYRIFSADQALELTDVVAPVVSQAGADGCDGPST